MGEYLPAAIVAVLMAALNVADILINRSRRPGVSPERTDDE